MSLLIFVLAIKNLLIGNILFVIMGILFNNNPTGSIYKKLSLRTICLTKCTVGWVEKWKMSKIYHGHEVSVIIHKNKDFLLFTF